MGFKRFLYRVSPAILFSLDTERFRLRKRRGNIEKSFSGVFRTSGTGIINCSKIIRSTENPYKRKIVKLFIIKLMYFP